MRTLAICLVALLTTALAPPSASAGHDGCTPHALDVETPSVRCPPDPCDVFDVCSDPCPDAASRVCDLGQEGPEDEVEKAVALALGAAETAAGIVQRQACRHLGVGCGVS